MRKQWAKYIAQSCKSVGGFSRSGCYIVTSWYIVASCWLCWGGKLRMDLFNLQGLERSVTPANVSVVQFSHDDAYTCVYRCTGRGCQGLAKWRSTPTSYLLQAVEGSWFTSLWLATILQLVAIVCKATDRQKNVGTTTTNEATSCTSTRAAAICL